MKKCFSPVVKMTQIHCLIVLDATRTWDLYQLDVNNAFLHGDLSEEVYMKILDGIIDAPNMVCKLRKSIYGLKQASKTWFEKLVHELLDQDFVQSKNDYSLFLKKSDSNMIIFVVYVVDIIVTSNDFDTIAAIKCHLNNTFGIKDFGKLNYFLGIEVR